MKQLSFIIIATALVAGCAGSTELTRGQLDDLTPSIDTVQINGPMRLDIRDLPLNAATVPSPAASITTTAGAIVASNWELGSLCRYALAGAADIRGNKVGVHVLLAERTTSCIAEARVLQYSGTVTIAPGIYDVVLVRESNNVSDTLARKSVTVD